jgi:hypothetical protein
MGGEESTDQIPPSWLSSISHFTMGSKYEKDFWEFRHVAVVQSINSVCFDKLKYR